MAIYIKDRIAVCLPPLTIRFKPGVLNYGSWMLEEPYCHVDMCFEQEGEGVELRPQFAVINKLNIDGITGDTEMTLQFYERIPLEPPPKPKPGSFGDYLYD